MLVLKNFSIPESLYEVPAITWVLVIGMLIALALNFSTVFDQTFIFLAQSFLQGKLYFVNETIYDTAAINGFRYWVLGPFPAVMLMPFVLLFSFFSIPFLQGYVNFFLGISVVLLGAGIAYSVCRNKDDAWYWAAALSFSSPLLAVIMLPVYAHFAHLITVALILFALYEYVNRRRFWIIGTLFSFILFTRMTAVVGALFFILDILTRKISWSEKMRSIIHLCIPLGIATVLFALYNYARFGNPLETGYALQQLIEPLEATRAYGLFSIAHVPGNLYTMLVAGPIPYFRDAVSHVLAFPFIRPDQWGMSLFVTSPLLFLLFFFSYRERLSRLLIPTIIAIGTPIIFYYGIGFRQFGYRYALDFFPFLFFLFIVEYYAQHAALSRGLKRIIIISVLVNLYLFFGYLYVPNT